MKLEPVRSTPESIGCRPLLGACQVRDGQDAQLAPPHPAYNRAMRALLPLLLLALATAPAFAQNTNQNTPQGNTGNMPAYEVLPSDGVRNLPGSRNGSESTTGPRVWNVIKF